MRYLKQKQAQLIDEMLMSDRFGFSIYQLMELAGLSVACAVSKEFPINVLTKNSSKRNTQEILIVAGPGNNGGDALVAARHLKHFGYTPTILYPKRSSKPLFQGILNQCIQLDIPFLEALPEPNIVDEQYDIILDGIFGFSFEGSIRPPFDLIVSNLNACNIPIISIDIPSGWHVEDGNTSGLGLNPEMLISLTAPKLCAKEFTKNDKIHYIGGRFVPKILAQEMEFDIPNYIGMEQCIKVTNDD